jgi:hypothetical protein
MVPGFLRLYLDVCGIGDYPIFRYTLDAKGLLERHGGCWISRYGTPSPPLNQGLALQQVLFFCPRFGRTVKSPVKIDPNGPAMAGHLARARLCAGTVRELRLRHHGHPRAVVRQRAPARAYGQAKPVCQVRHAGAGHQASRTVGSVPLACGAGMARSADVGCREAVIRSAAMDLREV